MPTTADLRPQLKQNLNGVDISPNWAEILNYLDSNGPATTGEILENITLDSKQGIRHALYSLMSLDIRKDEIDDQIIVKDRINRTYGLPGQVPNEHDARGVIPIQPSERRRRILDEIARRLDNEISEELDDASEIIARIVDRKPEQIHKLKRRAEAFEYPFEVWAANKYPKQDRATVIDAVSALANCTDNVSRQLLSSVIADVFEQNDEEHLADLLNNWAQSNEEYKKQSSQPNKNSKNEAFALTDEEQNNGQSHQTLDEEINHSDRADQTSSNSDDSDGHSLSPLSLVESEADGDTSEEESSHGLN
jgi:bacterioferritin (cytochrome b1)